MRSEAKTWTLLIQASRTCKLCAHVADLPLKALFGGGFEAKSPKNSKLLANCHHRYPLNEVGRGEKRAKSEFFGEGKIWLSSKFMGSLHPSCIGVADARQPSQNCVSRGLQCTEEVAIAGKYPKSSQLS
jgi:hypothetical protein